MTVLMTFETRETRPVLRSYFMVTEILMSRSLRVFIIEVRSVPAMPTLSDHSTWSTLSDHSAPPCTQPFPQAPLTPTLHVCPEDRLPKAESVPSCCDYGILFKGKFSDHISTRLLGKFPAELLQEDTHFETFSLSHCPAVAGSLT